MSQMIYLHFTLYRIPALCLHWHRVTGPGDAAAGPLQQAVHRRQDPLHLRHGQEEALYPEPQAVLLKWTGRGGISLEEHQSDLKTFQEEAEHQEL